MLLANMPADNLLSQKKSIKEYHGNLVFVAGIKVDSLILLVTPTGIEPVFQP
jgi:hypothetical protein